MCFVALLSVSVFFGAMSYGLIFFLCLLHLSTSWTYSATLFSLWCQAWEVTGERSQVRVRGERWEVSGEGGM